MDRPLRTRERPRPDAYDELWQLLPVFIAFLTILLVVAQIATTP